MNNSNEKIRLTQYAKAAGCSCKIAPAVLQDILRESGGAQAAFDRLLVGNNAADDAAVYQLNENEALIATIDFFTPIVDDAFDYGRIAAANALSDVYAMGGRPLIALAILGWPEALPAALAAQVLAGAKAVCAEAGIPLAGGHSIVTAEPVFGLSVNGLAAPGSIKTNSGAKPGDWLLLTKPIGNGILSTAAKRGQLAEEDYPVLLQTLTGLNRIGEALGGIAGVHAMTDVTGFGLAGHLTEMAAGSGLSAELFWNKIPLLAPAKTYAAQGISPDATFRNWNAVSAGVSFGTGVDVMEAFRFLPDPQTNGGLLIAVEDAALSEVQELLRRGGFIDFTEPVGRMKERGTKVIEVLV